MKTSELIGPALDWAVAKCENTDYFGPATKFLGEPYFRYSTDWAQGGPIIEREIAKGMNLYGDGSRFGALYYNINAEQYTAFSHFGPTPLISAMRCYVASKLGDDIDIPEELK